MAQSIYVEHLSHNAPIPGASKNGPFLATSAISGLDAKSGKLAEDFDGQCHHAFENLGLFLAAAEMSLADVVKLTVFVTDNAARTQVNKHWIKAFPNESARPARHILLMPFRNDVLIQIEALAFSSKS